MPKRSQRPIVSLHAIVARKADVAVVLRRGPSKLVQLLKWDLRTDEIEPGQWFKGEIRAGDLSPDGKRLVYFANRHKGDPASWIAVSHPPYLTALALWPSNWIHGYGKFVNNRVLVLPDASRKLHPKFAEMMRHPRAVRIVRSPAEVPFGLIPKTWYGWRVDQTKPIKDDKPKDWQWFVGKLLDPSVSRNPRRWCKGQPSGLHALVKTDASGGFRYQVLTALGRVRRDMGQVDWADWDHCGQLLYAGNGCLWRVADVADAKAEPKLVADLSANKFTEVVAPDWAKQW